MRSFEKISSGEVHLADATIRYRELGQGPSIVFVHGLLTNGRLWRKVANELQGSLLPPMFRPLQYAARVPGALYLAVQGLRVRPLRRLPMAFGWLAKRQIPHDIVDGWLRPSQTRRATRRDTARFLRAIGTADTLDVAARLTSFQRPVLLAWATEDRVFPFDHARRLTAIFPHATVAPIVDSYSFVPEHQPERLAKLIRDFSTATGDGRQLTS